MAKSNGMECMFCGMSPCECNKPAPKVRTPRKKASPEESATDRSVAPNVRSDRTGDHPAAAPVPPSSSPMASGAMAAAAASATAAPRPSVPVVRAHAAQASAPVVAAPPVVTDEDASLADKYPHDEGDEHYKAMRVMIESGLLHPDDQAKLEREYPVRYPPQLRAEAARWKKDFSGNPI